MKKLRNTIGGLVLAATITLAGCVPANSPHATFTRTPKEGYPPLEVTFDAGDSSSPNGAIVSYAWDFGDDEAGDGVTVDHLYTEKGVYAVTLVVTDSVGATGARTQAVEALNRAPVAKFEADHYYVTVGETVWFDAEESYDPDGEIVEYLWDFGDGDTEEGPYVSHQYTTANGSGWRPTITLTVVDDDRGVGVEAQKLLVAGCDSCGS
ncbi:MAG: PKD domain-containing protein [Candidatus Bipolaricaulis sp.]|nr:PKD domain-containing protein [Candidatus Bipolaricaulis sp.]